MRSIVGRFLEHSRVMYFGNGGEAEWWLGSADLMHRNLDRRVEVLLRVSDETARRELDDIFDARDGAGRALLGAAAATAAGSARTGRTTRPSGWSGWVSSLAEPDGRLVAAGGGALWRPAAGGGHRDGGRAPAALRRLVAAQGQARRAASTP